MFRTSALLLAISVMLTSVFQKLIILTLPFGETLWVSIDEFTSFVLNQFLFNESNKINFSFSILLISIYAGIHILAGVMIGILAGKFPQRINDLHSAKKLSSFHFNKDEELTSSLKKNKGKKKWWTRKSGLTLLIFSVVFVITSYIFPEFGKDRTW